MPKPLLLPLPETIIRLRRAVAEILEASRTRPVKTPERVPPDEIATGLEQFLTIAQRLDRGERETGPMLKQEVTRLGEYGLSLLGDMMGWADHLALPSARTLLDETTISAADWVMRHEGELRSLDALVNALAAIANRTREQEALEILERYMARVVQAAGNLVRQDDENNRLNRPWRVLHLNRSIVATRTHKPEIMEQAFDELVRYLPDDAPQFFAEGMEQMAALDYPPQVRAVVSRYFERFTRHTMH